MVDAINFLRPSDKIAISISNLDATYVSRRGFLRLKKSRVMALEDVTCEIPVGNIQLLGESGHGKTTLMKALAISLGTTNSFRLSPYLISRSRLKLRGDVVVNRMSYSSFGMRDDEVSNFYASSSGECREDRTVQLVTAHHGISTRSEEVPFTIFVYNGRVRAFGDTSRMFESYREIEGMEEYVGYMKRLGYEV